MVKAKKVILFSLIITLVLAFSVFALGAGKNTDDMYVGEWEYNSDNNFVLYPCHTGEFYTKSITNGYISVKYSFTWEVDNNYLVIHGFDENYEGVMCFLSDDGGQTMKRISISGGYTYTKQG